MKERNEKTKEGGMDHYFTAWNPGEGQQLGSFKPVHKKRPVKPSPAQLSKPLKTRAFRGMHQCFRNRC